MTRTFKIALLIVAAPAQAQDAGGAAPDKGTVATQPVGDSQGAAVGVQPSKVDPKLLIDVFNRLTRPRTPPMPPPPVPAPAPAPSAGAVPAPAPVKPAVVVAPAAPAPAVAAPVAVPRAVRPRSVPSAKPPPPAESVPATPTTTTVVQPPSPPAATPAEPAAPAPEAPVAISPARETPAPVPAEPPGYFLAAGILLPLIALLAAAAAIAAGLSFNRARRIARTRAALALSPSLDLSMGDFSLGGLALAGPSVAIRARLDPPEARSG